MNNEINLRLLTENDIDEIISAFKSIGLNKPRSTYESYIVTT